MHNTVLSRKKCESPPNTQKIEEPQAQWQKLGLRVEGANLT